MKQKKEENTESLELTVCAAWSDWRKRTQFRTRVSTEGMKLFTRFRLPILLPELIVFARFRAHLGVPFQHGQDDGEHTADEQQHRQKGERGKRASPLLFIVFHIHSPIQIRTAFFKLSHGYSLFCFFTFFSMMQMVSAQ